MASSSSGMPPSNADGPPPRPCWIGASSPSSSYSFDTLPLPWAHPPAFFSSCRTLIAMGRSSSSSSSRWPNDPARAFCPIAEALASRLVLGLARGLGGASGLPMGGRMPDLGLRSSLTSSSSSSSSCSPPPSTTGVVCARVA